MLKTPYSPLPPSTNNQTSTYTKVIVIKIDNFESIIVDEHHFGIDDIEEINDFKESYNPKEYVCVMVNVDWENFVS